MDIENLIEEGARAYQRVHVEQNMCVKFRSVKDTSL